MKEFLVQVNRIILAGENRGDFNFQFLQKIIGVGIGNIPENTVYPVHQWTCQFEGFESILECRGLGIVTDRFDIRTQFLYRAIECRPVVLIADLPERRNPEWRVPLREKRIGTVSGDQSGINVSRVHPIREFVVLTAGFLGAIALLVLVIGFMAGSLAAYIPFSAERNISLGEASEPGDATPIGEYLQSLADRAVAAAELPDDMSITVHYVDDDTVNAFATLGGNLVFYRGLLERLPNENALAMVVAHEVAHIKHRHPIRSLGRGVAIATALSLINSSAGNAAAIAFRALLVMSTLASQSSTM